MARLIDADALIEAMTKFNNATGEDMTHGIFYAHIAPTVEAVPVKHGEWVFNPSDAFEAMFAKPKCSECGFESADGGNYCSNCGARMDKDE